MLIKLQITDISKTLAVTDIDHFFFLKFTKTHIVFQIRSFRKPYASRYIFRLFFIH